MLLSDWKLIRFLLFQQLRANHFPKILILWFPYTKPTITCSKLTIETLKQGVKYVQLIIKTPERRHWSRFGVFIVNFEYILYFVIVFLLLTLNR